MLRRHDWFHVLLRASTWLSFLFLLFIWTSILFMFAGFYVLVDNRNPDVYCGLGPVGSPIQYGPAFAFSLETCATVGYGLPNGVNSFFENCPSVQVVIYVQMIWSILFNALLISFFYASLARAENRGNQVILSNKAIVSMVDGQVRFQVRVFDIDAANPVLEARVRLYAVTKSRPVPRPLRMLQPNDELVAMLFMSVPSVVTHRVDLYSLLHPPCETRVEPSGLVVRQADSGSGGREDVTCPVCGESYGTHERWRNHVKFQRIAEETCGYPIVGTHLSLKESDFMLAPTIDVERLKDYIASEISEVFAVVEGIEPLSSLTFSALQSYRFEDMIFQPGARFRPCIEAVKGKNGSDSFFRVDLNRFHAVDNVAEPISAANQRVRSKSSRTQDAFFTDIMQDQEDEHDAYKACTKG